MIETHTTLQRSQTSKIQWLSYPLFRFYPRLRCATFLRLGGVSTGPFASLNFSISCGDDPANVEENWALAKSVVKEAWGIEEDLSLIRSGQNHGKNTLIVDAATPEKTGLIADIQLTKEPYKALCSLHADCQVALFYDPSLHVLAVAHAGWKGQVLGVYQETIQQMKHAFGCKPENLLVAISPSLGPCHSQFVNYKSELPPSFWEYQVKPLYFDLWAISEDQLQAAGILKKNIEIARICTVDHPREFFSYRYNSCCGRNATIAVLI
jgi:polyphenol oxidase